jgi:hypothetical protein
VLTIGLLVAGLALSACGGGDPPLRATRDPAGGAGAVATRYEADISVLESPEHGPQLCDAMATSLPPLCGGPDVVGWDWDTVTDEESYAGTTWGTYHLTGTFDGRRFTLTAPPGRPRPGPTPRLDFSPACAHPDVVDPDQGIAAWMAVPGGGPDLVTSWVSDPAGEWDGPFVASVVVRPGAAAAARERIRETYAGALCVVERDAPTADQLAGVQRELFDHEATERLGQVMSAGPYGRLGKVVATVWVADQAKLDYTRDRWGDLVQLSGLLQPVS